MAQRRATTRGFKCTSALLDEQIRRVGESRGFAVSRLLTHWDEIAGPAIAPVARPVKITYGRGGLGATLTLLTTGPQAVMLEMQKERLREKVNAVYGYNAISRVRITQTAPTALAEDQTPYAPPPPAHGPGAPGVPAREPAPELSARARNAAGSVQNEPLRAALEQLACNILSRTKP